jgi:hypothetical protein
VRKRMERNEGEEGEREAVRERKGEKGSEEDNYFNKFPPTMPYVFDPTVLASWTTLRQPAVLLLCFGVALRTMELELWLLLMVT